LTKGDLNKPKKRLETVPEGNTISPEFFVLLAANWTLLLEFALTGPAKIYLDYEQNCSIKYLGYLMRSNNML